MTSDRKKPGVAFWATVVVVVVLVAYPLSFGPACWLTYSGILRHRTIARVYWPLLLARIKAQYPVRYSVHWYGSIGMPERAGISVEVPALDGRSYTSRFIGRGNP
jgi:hypothetical protein